MPPKAKFTRKEIIQVALDITRVEGIEAVTAREIGRRLNSSPRPIFTVFDNMEEVQKEVIFEAIRLLRGYFQTSKEYIPEFKRFGMMMIQFAKDEPKLFQLLLMRESPNKKNYTEMIEGLGADTQYCIEILQRDYGLSEKMSKKMLNQLWLHSYGISVLCATKMCSFSEEEISQMLSEVFMGLLTLIQTGKIDE